MNGIDNILKKISADAENDAREIINEAYGDAEDIKNDEKTVSDAECARIISSAKSEYNETVRRAVSMAELEARKEKLRVKQELITQAFDEAYEKLRALPADSYLKLLVSLASSCNGGELIFSAADRAKYGKQVVMALAGMGKSFSLSVEIRPLNGGLIVKEGNVETNCELKSILRLARDNLSLGVANILF